MRQGKAETKSFKSARIQVLFDTFPDLSLQLSFFDKAFDHDIAKSKGWFSFSFVVSCWVLRDAISLSLFFPGEIIPNKGSYRDFDQVNAIVVAIVAELEEYLERQKKEHGFKTLKYKDVGGSPFQLEVPKSVKVPSNYTVMSSTAVRMPISKQLGEKNKRKQNQTNKKRLVVSFAIECAAVLDRLHQDQGRGAC